MADFLQAVDSLTALNARVVLEQGLAAIQAGQHALDLGKLATVDSAAVAVLLEWQRAARTAGAALVLNNVPASLQSLASLYGVDSLLALTPVTAAH